MLYPYNCRRCFFGFQANAITIGECSRVVPAVFVFALNRSKLLSAIKLSGQRIRADNVEYMTLQELQHRTPNADKLPFLKRYPFTDEQEFRIICESETKKMSALDVPIPFSCIDKIILSPWMPYALFPHVQRLLRNIPGCGKLKITRSTLISNDQWKNFAERVVP